MSRPLFLGNGSVLVGINNKGSVQEFYYPYVGLEDHVSSKSSPHRIGVWVDGSFSWLDDGLIWEIEQNYFDKSLVGQTKLRSNNLGLELELNDFVDSELNAFCRYIKVHNLHGSKRCVRIFLHQVFFISASIRGDTAVYLPSDEVIMHYKGRRVFTVAAQNSNGESFDQFSIGVHGIEGKEGTYRDAEDGELSGNAVEHGKVDSTIRIGLELEPNQSQTASYWISAAATKQDALKIDKSIRVDGLESRLNKTIHKWEDWLESSTLHFDYLDDHKKDKARKSLMILKSHIDRRGSILASGDSEMLNYERDNYSYFWPRDGAFVIWPLMRMGYSDEAKTFFEFIRDVLTPEGYLMHKYQPDRAIGSSWHPYYRNGKEELPIQEDETAIVIFMLGEFLRLIKDNDFVSNLYPTLVRPAANFLESFIDSDTKLPHASYDLWEEKFLTTTYSTAVTYAALLAAAKIADYFEYPDDAIKWRTTADDIKVNARETFFNHDTGYFYKGYLLNHENGMLEFDDTIDASSLYGAAMFGLYDFDDSYTKTSAATFESKLLNSAPAGGVPRYIGDRYRAAPGTSGNPWPVTTLWYAQYLTENGENHKAWQLVDWVTNLMSPSAVLPEQVDALTGKHHDISVSPLTWSQAEYINTLLDLA